MQLQALYLRNFRNYQEAEVVFSPHLNAICGANAQGKTNLLEAIFLIATGRSFRTQHLSELVREKESFFYLEAQIFCDGVLQKAVLSFEGKTKHLQLNAHSFTTFAPLLGTLPLILFSPGDIDLIAGSPALRRRLLNLHLAQSDPLYVLHLSRFWRAMQQRNHLLRTRSDDSIECWEFEMARCAAFLQQMRLTWIQEIQTPLYAQSSRLAEEHCELRFHSAYPPQKENYLQQLHKNRPREKELGFTLAGPHRDDFSFWIDGKPARLFASEGQKKTALASLRLAEWERLSKQIGHPPLFAIDDLHSSLDEKRKHLLRDSLKTLGQVFIATPSLEGANSYSIHIERGKIFTA